MPDPGERPLPRVDESSDALFYRQPRFVTHIDDAAIRAVTGLYREVLPPGGRVLDLMSSWVSHLPPEVEYARVVGLGMNEAELARNERLNAYVVHDLNADPRLPFADAEFDACTICVSIDYLTRPVSVLREVARVLTPGGPLVVTFSNRCFPTKAVLPWHRLDDAGHVSLVSGWLKEAGFVAVEGLDRSPAPGRSDPLFAVVGHAG
ncbi:class I SAM-dependent methyltransferase [Deinococcus pimensis]|uniref:class I SAM-dependent methyltransferase n=1 Tax=Deinococcus pimensis TaxID=309888 RepID=UPI000482F7E5|nr:methyltransferase domain-containing protein [Deinococcus pimensis]